MIPLPVRSRSWILCLLLLAWSSLAAGRTSLLVQGVSSPTGPDATYTSDATLIRGDPSPTAPLTAIENGNWGVATLISVGREMSMLQRSLLRFPLAGLAGKYTHLGRARLILSLKYPPLILSPPKPWPSPIRFELYRVATANVGWVEGGAMIGETTEGTACWGWRKSPATTWAGLKGCGKAGVDFQADPISSATLTGETWIDGSPLVFEINQPDLIEEWITHPERNAGFLLRSSTLEAIAPGFTVLSLRFYSDDEPNPVRRPRLEVESDALPSEALATAAFQAGVVNREPNTAYNAQCTSLFSGNDGSYGGASELCLGIEPWNLLGHSWRSLLKFDIARLLDYCHNVRVLRLVLTVQSVQASGSAAAAFQLCELHRIAPANASWKEGVQTGGAAETGAATWGWLAQGRTPWAGGNPQGGGLQIADTDYVLPPLDRVLLVPAELHEGSTVTFEMPNTGFVYNWIARPANNAGFRLVSPTLEAAGANDASNLAVIRFYSDDATVRAKRPRLELIYATKLVKTAADWIWLAHQ